MGRYTRSLTLADTTFRSPTPRTPGLLHDNTVKPVQLTETFRECPKSHVESRYQLERSFQNPVGNPVSSFTATCISSQHPNIGKPMASEACEGHGPAVAKEVPGGLFEKEAACCGSQVQAMVRTPWSWMKEKVCTFQWAMVREYDVGVGPGVFRMHT